MEHSLHFMLLKLMFNSFMLARSIINLVLQEEDQAHDEVDLMAIDKTEGMTKTHKASYMLIGVLTNALE